MLNSTITVKVKQRLNKLDSNDYDNIECWMIVEAFNKAQVEWARRQLHGVNMMKEGDEQSTRRIDDLQALLENDILTLTDKVDYFSAAVPKDYLQWKRVDVFAKKDCCENKHFTFQLSEECENHEFVNNNSEVVSIDFIFPPTTNTSLIIPAEFISYAGYAPPEILKDFPSIFQIFRL